MQGDPLLQEWKAAKQICCRIIQICKMSHLEIGTVKGIRVQIGSKQTSKQFMNVYNIVYRLCMTKQKQQNRVQMVYKDYKDMLKSVILQISKLILQEKDIYRLNVLRKIWQCYCDIQKRLNNMFAYLNRPFHIKQGKIEDLDKTSSNIIISALFMENSIQEYEILYFKEIDKIRKTKDFSNQTILANLVDIFYKIHLKIVKQTTVKKAKTIYTELYGHYQKKSKQYYGKQFKSLQNLSPSEYFIKVNELYCQQKQLAQNCFVITGQNIFLKEFADQLMHTFKSTLITSQYGLKYIIKQGQIEILKLICQLYLKLTKSVDGFKEQFQQYVFQEMKNHLDQNKAELVLKKALLVSCNFVQKIVRKNKQLLQVLDSMSKIGDFVHSYKNGMEKAFIHSKLSIPIEELLAIYTDTKLKLQLQQQQFENQVKHIITIFNCIQNKDLFLLKYSQRLVKRVMNFSLTGLNNNEIFVTNLKKNCGAIYTERLQTILTEYRISNDFQDQLDKIQKQEKLPISLCLKVFSQGAWPTQSIIQVPVQYLPSQIIKAQQSIAIFKNQYLSKKTLKISALQSKIRWVYYFDESTVLSNKNCYFDTNCLQAAMLFYIYRNRPNKIPFRFFEQMLKVPAKLLKQNLNKMSEGVDKLLLRTSIEQDEEPYYQFNLKLMTNKKILLFDQGNSQQQEKLFQQNDLGKDREIIIDANISKLMKSRKILNFKSIIEEVIKMIKIFVPQSKDIKMAIDRLISKQILQRDEKDRQLIRYKD